MAANSSTWKPGKSANPGGRTKLDRDVRDLARAHTKEAIQKLADLMRNAQSERTQAAAANALLDRGWGRPLQTLEATLLRSSAVELTDDELNDIARGCSDGAAEETSGAEESPELH